MSQQRLASDVAGDFDFGAPGLDQRIERRPGAVGPELTVAG
jgi:hypothetical protein